MPVSNICTYSVNSTEEKQNLRYNELDSLIKYKVNKYKEIYLYNIVILIFCAQFIIMDFINIILS